MDQAERLASLLKKGGRGFGNSVVLGPVPALLSRLRKDYRYQILLKGSHPTRLRALLDQGLHAFRALDHKGVRLIVDVDPQN